MDHRKHAAKSRERMKGYAMGGAVNAYDDAAQDAKEDLSQTMQTQSNRRSDQFRDTGLRAPGRQAERNHQWEKAIYGKSSIVKD